MERLQHLLRPTPSWPRRQPGTLTEFFLVWNHIFLDRGHGPLVCLGESWRGRLETLGGGVRDRDEVRALVRVASDPVEAVLMLAAGRARRRR